VFSLQHKKSVMAYANKIIRNPQSGQEIKFIQTTKDTGGKLLEMEASFKASSKEPAPHYHPKQKEDFTVISGEINIRLDDKLLLLTEGDKLHIPANAIHSMWNPGNEKAIVNWKVQPALDTEYFLETASGLAAEGKVNDKGMPPLLQVALIAKKFSTVFRLASLPYIFQQILFGLLAPFAYLAGYKPVYKRFLD
jgi:quercetin dioxygenase-like cupin family protein